MHWIERLVGFSPDGGSGATEVALLVTTSAVIVLQLVRRLHDARSTSDAKVMSHAE